MGWEAYLENLPGLEFGCMVGIKRNVRIKFVNGFSHRCQFPYCVCVKSRKVIINSSQPINVKNGRKMFTQLSIPYCVH